MSPEEVRVYAQRYGLIAASDTLIARIAELSATVDATGCSIPRSRDQDFEPAAIFTVHLPEPEPTR